MSRATPVMKKEGISLKPQVPSEAAATWLKDVAQNDRASY